jgi:hypothetical protein
MHALVGATAPFAGIDMPGCCILLSSRPLLLLQAKTPPTATQKQHVLKIVSTIG